MAVTLALNGQPREIDVQNIARSDLLTFRVDPESGEDFLGLVTSIRKHGLIHPIVVRASKTNSEQPYEIVCGHRRLAACKKLGLSSVSCVVQELSDRNAFEIALSENLQRQSLNPIEEAEAFKSYIVNFGRGSISELSRRIGKSAEYVSHRLMLLGLPKPIIEKIRRRLLKPGEATELIWLGDSSKQLDLAQEITRRGLSFRQTRSAVKLLKNSNMTVNDSLQKVLNEKNNNVCEKEESVHPEAPQNPWGSFKAESEADDIQILDHAILILRTCLAGLDLLSQKEQSEETLAIVMRERHSVHRVLDEVISQKVKSSKNPILLK